MKRTLSLKLSSIFVRHLNYLAENKTTGMPIVSVMIRSPSKVSKTTVGRSSSNINA